MRNRSAYGFTHPSTPYIVFAPLDALHVCSDSSGWCPEPNCDGPLKPPRCHKNNYSGNSGSSTSSSSNSSSSNSGNSGSSSSGSYSGGNGGEAQYTDYQYEEEAVYEDGEGEGAEYAAGNFDYEAGSGANHGDSIKEPTRAFNPMMYIVGALAVAGVVGAFLMKKNKSKSDEEDEIDHQLSQSVQKRLESLLAGKSVPPVNEEPSLERTTSFLGVKDPTPGVAGAAAGALPKKDDLAYDEPDQEAIEMKLNESALDSYVQMA